MMLYTRNMLIVQPQPIAVNRNITTRISCSPRFRYDTVQIYSIGWADNASGQYGRAVTWGSSQPQRGCESSRARRGVACKPQIVWNSDSVALRLSCLEAMDGSAGVVRTNGQGDALPVRSGFTTGVIG